MLENSNLGIFITLEKKFELCFKPWHSKGLGNKKNQHHKKKIETKLHKPLHSFVVEWSISKSAIDNQIA